MFKFLSALNVSEAATQAAKDASDMSIKFHPDQFLPNLKYMGLGMLCIFIVIGVIIASIYLMNFFTNLSNKKEKTVKEKKPKKDKKVKSSETAE